MKRLIQCSMVTLSLATVSLAFPAMAQATDAYVAGNVNLRAGPDAGYPWIMTIPAGTGIDVQGCTAGWEWCDVIVYGNRGWIAGNYIEYDYRDQPVLLPNYGVQIGIPIISFVIGTYWDNYYRGKPFYRQRDHWYHRPMPRRPPPPPMRHPYRGPVHHGNQGQPHGVVLPRGPSHSHGRLGPVNPGHPVYASPGQFDHSSPAPASNHTPPTSHPTDNRNDHGKVDHGKNDHSKNDHGKPDKHDDHDH